MSTYVLSRLSCSIVARVNLIGRLLIHHALVYIFVEVEVNLPHHKCEKIHVVQLELLFINL